MNRITALTAALLAATSFILPSAHAAAPWIGSADYRLGLGAAGDEEVVGPFSTYDFGTGVVLLEQQGTVGSTTSFNGYYQAFVTRHELFGAPVAAPLLDNTYELTVGASFTQTVTTTGSTATISVNPGGTFKLYRDTTKDREYASTSDTGFTDGDVIITGTILGGTGAAIAAGGMIFGVTDLNIQITSYDAAIYDPDTITGGDGIFTLRLGAPSDQPFLSSVDFVQGHSANDANDFKFAADGNIALAVPEIDTYAMMLAGLGLIGFVVSRRRHT